MSHRVTAGQLWVEARNVDTAAFRTVRWFVIVAVDGGQVTTADVDHHAWCWRPRLRSHGPGDVERVEVTGPYQATAVAALQHRHFIQLAHAQDVDCVIPTGVPVQAALFEPPAAVS